MAPPSGSQKPSFLLKKHKSHGYSKGSKSRRADQDGDADHEDDKKDPRVRGSQRRRAREVSKRTREKKRLEFESRAAATGDAEADPNPEWSSYYSSELGLEKKNKLAVAVGSKLRRAGDPLLVARVVESFSRFELESAGFKKASAGESRYYEYFKPESEEISSVSAIQRAKAALKRARLRGGAVETDRSAVLARNLLRAVPSRGKVCLICVWRLELALGLVLDLADAYELIVVCVDPRNPEATERLARWIRAVGGSRLNVVWLERRANQADLLGSDLFVESFNLVVLQAPSSEDARFSSPNAWASWRPRTAEILAPLQREALRVASDCCVVGGHVLYATNSVNPTENERVVRSVLEDASGALEAVEGARSDFDAVLFGAVLKKTRATPADWPRLSTTTELSLARDELAKLTNEPSKSVPVLDFAEPIEQLLKRRTDGTFVEAFGLKEIASSRTVSRNDWALSLSLSAIAWLERTRAGDAKWIKHAGVMVGRRAASAEDGGEGWELTSGGLQLLSPRVTSRVVQLVRFPPSVKDAAVENATLDLSSFVAFAKPEEEEECVGFFLLRVDPPEAQAARGASIASQGGGKKRMSTAERRALKRGKAEDGKATSRTQEEEEEEDAKAQGERAWLPMRREGDGQMGLINPQDLELARRVFHSVT